MTLYKACQFISVFHNNITNIFLHKIVLVDFIIKLFYMLNVVSITIEFHLYTFYYWDSNGNPKQYRETVLRTIYTLGQACVAHKNYSNQRFFKC